MQTAFDLTAGVIVNMDDAIYMVSPLDSPMLTGVQADGLSVITTQGVDEVSFSWQNENILTPRSLISATVTTGDGYITVTTGDQAKFSTGDLLRCIKSGASEYMRCTGYGSTADTLLVSRGFDSTTATNFAANDKVRVVGTALAEGSDPENSRSKDRDLSSNYTQIFGPTLVHMSRTEQRVRKYGVANEFSHQMMNRISENVIAREYAALYGRKYTSTTTKIRLTGGAFQFVTTNSDTTSTQLTVSTAQSLQQKGYNKGRVFEILAAHPASLSDLNDITNTNIVRVQNVDTMRGRARVTVVVTEFGDLTIARNRWMETSDALGFSRDNFKRRVLDPLQAERLAKTGDSDKMQLVCEEGWEIKGEQHCAKMSALSYTNVE